MNRPVVAHRPGFLDRSMSNYDNSSNEDGGVECPTCGDVFKTERGMKVHHKKTHGKSISGKPVQCEWCGDTFRVQASRVETARFCSYDCTYEWRRESEDYGGENHPNYTERVPLDCEECGDEFRVVPHRIGRARFCSKDCQNAAHSKRMSGDGAPWWNGGMVELSCQICGSAFTVKPSRSETARFCTPQCRSVHHGMTIQGEDHPRWSEYPQVPCQNCGEVLIRPPAVANRSKRNFCDQKCHGEWLSEHRSGSDSWNWDGGEFPYGPGWNEAKKEMVRERDGRTCQECGLDEVQHIRLHGRKHHVHHVQKAREFIDAELRNHPDNLVTLCHGDCHKSWEAISPFRPTVIGRR